MLLTTPHWNWREKYALHFIPLNPAVPEQLWHHSQKAPDNQGCIVEGSCLGCGPYPKVAI